MMKFLHEFEVHVKPKNHRNTYLHCTYIEKSRCVQICSNGGLVSIFLSQFLRVLEEKVVFPKMDVIYCRSL